MENLNNIFKPKSKKEIINSLDLYPCIKKYILENNFKLDFNFSNNMGYVDFKKIKIYYFRDNKNNLFNVTNNETLYIWINRNLRNLK